MVSLSPAAAALAAVILATPPERPSDVVVAGLVNAPPGQVWDALTTPEGVSTFFSEHALVERHVGGAYEMYFLPRNPPGLRGGEGVRILAMEPPSRFLITWNAPPHFPMERRQHTTVQFELLAAEDDATLVCITQSGWGRGQGWQKVRDYFDSAWKVILGRLQYRFDEGPVDWRDRPDGADYFKPAEAGSACA